MKEYLHYDPKKPIDINNRPKLYFVGDKTPKTIHSLRNLQHDEWKGGQDRDPKRNTKPKDEHTWGRMTSVSLYLKTTV